jgi:hypothetical protein
MKKCTLFIFIIFSLTYFSYGQSSIEWQKTFGGSDNDVANSIQQTTDNGYIITGYSKSVDGDLSVNNGNADYWILKLDSNGIKEWQKTLGGSGNEFANAIVQTSDGGYILAGSSNSNDSDITGNKGMDDYWIVKLETNGNVQWKKCMGGSNADGANSIQQTSDGGYIIAGSSVSNDGDINGTHHGTAAYTDYWIVKTDDGGSIQWQKSLGGTLSDVPTSIQQTTDGGYIVAGYSYSNDGDLNGNHHGLNIITDCWIVKLDATGNIQWQKSLGGDNYDNAFSIRQTSDGGYIFAGSSNSVNGDVTGNHGSDDYWIVKLNSTGDIDWQKSFGGSLNDRPFSIYPTNDGGYVVAGYSFSIDGDIIGDHHGTNNNKDYWILKIDMSGTILWRKSFGGTNNEEPYSIQQTTDNGFIVGGYTLSTNGDVTDPKGAFDFWIIKISSLVGIPEIESTIKNFEIRPNPFSNHTTISFELLSNENNQLVIYDIEGRAIKNIPSDNLIIGTNKFFWDATNNSGNKVESGIYFVTFISGNNRETKRMVILD